MQRDIWLDVSPQRQRIAVIGSGISGLAAAWLLSHRHRVTLFEAANHLGGHTNTVDVTLEGRTHPVDTGFLVFNDRTYPNLVALFAHLGVDSVPTEMSFSVSLESPELEWAGSTLGTLFRQKRNLLRPRFWSMLADILRFNRDARHSAEAVMNGALSLRDYLTEKRHSSAFTEWYLLPMAAAIWSCPTAQMLDMPLATFVRFCRNHGLLQIFDRPQWRTVKGGGREYVRRMAARLGDIRLACPVQRIERTASGLRVHHAHGEETFDQVVLACHSDQALAITREVLSTDQRNVLAAIRYQPNRAVLHIDRTLLPRDEKVWSAWNYFSINGETGRQPVGVSYLINRLQPLPFRTPVIVTLNPVRRPDPGKVIAWFEYEHPVLDGPAIVAQRRLAEVQGQHGVWLAGAWTGYGFHEDGLSSAITIANRFGILAPWQGITAPSPEPALA